jgi:hypothetical protein
VSEKVSADVAEQARATRGRLIGWEKYLDGEWHRLRQGEDFPGLVTSTRSAGLQWATRWGKHAVSNVESEGPGGTFLYRIDPHPGSSPSGLVWDGLSDAEIAVAKEIQRLEAEGASDGELSDAFRRARRVLKGLPPIADERPGDPVAKRRARLAQEAAESEQTLQGAFAKVVASRKAGAGRRRRSDDAVPSGGE